MEYNKIHIGQLIEQRMNDLKINKAELARRLNISSQYINRLFEKDSIDTNRLIEISKALDCDFFSYLRPIDGKGAVQTFGDNSPAVQNSNGEVNINSKADDALKQLLAEKERTIQILLRGNNIVLNNAAIPCVTASEQE